MTLSSFSLTAVCAASFLPFCLAAPRFASAQTTAPKADAAAAQANPDAPHVTQIYTVAPDVLAVEIEAGRVVPSKIMPYVFQTGDTRKEDKEAKSLDGLSTVRLLRGGREVGWLIGPKRDVLVSDEALSGSPLDAAPLDKPSAWIIKSADDAAFAGGKVPGAVHRKSKPTDWVQPSHTFAMRHIFYLKLNQKLTLGKKYTVSYGNNPARTFTYDPAKVRSEAVHVNQIGYRPDDVVKRAFLSVWLGTGGAFSYADGLRFSLVDDKTGKAVYSGKTVVVKKAGDGEAMWHGGPNRSKTDICRMDFGDFQTPGAYRVVVKGVGCSFPFVIGAKTWEAAFKTQMRGFYHQRSGMALGPPYTNYAHPRDLHPEDGVKVYASTYAATDGGDAFAGLWKGKTDTTVPGAWGGYHDAGDWNPRSTDHLQATLLQLELFDLFPKYFAGLKWNIPASHNLPDLLAEAEWHTSLFLRLQNKNGGVGHGIETTSDPYDGEVSWKQSQVQMAFAPDVRASYVYAATAARLSRLMAPYNKPLAQTYRQSAEKAMRWAEGDYAARTPDEKKKLPWETGDERNLAALELYALTTDPKYHTIFKETTYLTRPDQRLFVWESHVQYAAALAYARLPKNLGEPDLKTNAIAQTVREAELCLKYAEGNGFGLTTNDEGKPMFLGFFSVPDAQELVRAHVLTGDKKYLAGLNAACAFASGANPGNLTYTTGVGKNPPLHPLLLDARRSGQTSPEGITVYGNVDFNNWTDSFWTWPMTYYLNTACTPPAKDWPITEAYFDIFLYPATNEFTMNQTMGPNAYLWGYLAARP